MAFFIFAHRLVHNPSLRQGGCCHRRRSLFLAGFDAGGDGEAHGLFDVHVEG